MAVRDKSGFRKTPNGRYYNIVYVELVGIDIASGKFIIKSLDSEDLDQLIKEGHYLYLGTYYDFDYVKCIDEKKNLYY